MKFWHRSSRSWTPLAALVFSIKIGGLASGAIIMRSYTLSNYPGDQDGGAALLSGTITIQFDSEAGLEGGVLPLGNDGYDLLPQALGIMSWEFTVDKSSKPPTGPSTPPPGGIYSVASTETGDDITINTTQLGALVSYPDSLRLADGSLRLEKLEAGGALQTSLYWGKSDGGGTGIYFSNYRSNDVHGWETIDPSEVKAAQWEIGTAVPEPSAVLLSISGGLLVLLRRKRAARSDW